MKKLIINTDYTSLILSQTVSMMGSVVGSIAMMWILYDIFGKGAVVGSIYGLSALPGIILLPIIGGLIDSYDRKKILVLCDFLSFVLVILILISIYLKVLNPFIFTVILSAKSILGSTCSSTRSSLIQNLVKKNDIVKANSYQTIVNTTLQMGLPAVAGVLISLVSIELCFLIDAISYLLAAMITLRIKNYKFDKKSSDKYLAKITVGFKYLFKQTNLIKYISVFCLVNFLVGSIELLTRIYVVNFEKSASVYGTFESLLAVGGLIASVATLKLLKGELSKIGIFTTLGLILTGVGIGIMPLNQQFIALIIGSTILGLGISGTNIIFFTYAQSTIDKEFYGRVITTIFFINELIRPLSYYIFGYLADHIETFYVFSAISLSMIILGVLHYLINRSTDFTGENIATD